MAGLITADQIRRLLDYDKNSGIFRWRRRDAEMFTAGTRGAAHSAAIWNTRYAGKAAGVKDGYGYLVIRVRGRLYFAHRLAWLWMTGEWPITQIDHSNLVKTDNRWENLRPATYSQNAANARMRGTNSSGLKGVRWHVQLSKWQARIQKDGHQRHLGLFDTPEAAHAAYIDAARRLYGEFARTE